LFDAVAALIGLRQNVEFEGQSAMDLEFAIGNVKTNEAYPLRIVESGPSIMLDWSPLVEAILWDRAHGAGVGEIAARFHNALAESVIAIAARAGRAQVALSGGCFQNRYLLERIVTRLREESFQPYWHRRVPPNDGGIALGQIAAAWREHS
jgi:hydrogenase maturation protein HypF